MDWANEQVRARIAEAISEAEQRTSGEIVAVVAPSSDDYALIPVLWAALAALALPGALFLVTDFSAWMVYAIQLTVFLILAVVLGLEPFRYRVVPKSIAHRRSHRHAVDQFLSQNLHTTKARTGVLIFVSVAEHYAEIIADEGIYQKVQPSHWDAALAAMLAHIKQGEIEQGFLKAIGMSADVLAEHFPVSADDEDELPNHLIVLKGDEF